MSHHILQSTLFHGLALTSPTNPINVANHIICVTDTIDTSGYTAAEDQTMAPDVRELSAMFDALVLDID